MTEKERFCQNIKAHESSMYALAYSILQNDADAAEAISESVFRAYAGLDSLKNQAAFKAWILRIVHNTAVEMIRKNQKVVYLEEPIPENTVHREPDLATKLALRDAVDSLQQPYRTVVTLYYYENLSVLQIAAITDAKASAVRQQLSRARKMLRDLLQEDFKNA